MVGLFHEKKENRENKEGIVLKIRKKENNAYKYGMLGEEYVRRCIRCPRCDRVLLKNKVNTPGTDFNCRNNHWYQLKTMNQRKYSKTNIIKLLGGSYRHQINALRVPKLVDFLLLFYVKNEVRGVYWWRNEDVDESRIVPCVKRLKCGRVRENCVINCDPSLLLPVSFRYKRLGLGRRRLRRFGRVKFNWVYEVGGNMVDLSKMTCDCQELQNNSGIDNDNNSNIDDVVIDRGCVYMCDHYESAISMFLDHENTRHCLRKGGNFYMVDITLGRCSCGSVILCDHLKYFIGSSERFIVRDSIEYYQV